MLCRILVPLDGSPFAESSLPAAIALARQTTGEVRLVSVLENPSAVVLPTDFVSERAELDSYLSGVVHRVRGSWTGPVSTAARQGLVAAELEAEATAWCADVMVMCTHGRGGASRLWMGSVSDRCVRAGFCPVLLLRSPDGPTDPLPELRVDRVVVPLDGSELAERALPYAICVARVFGAHLVLLRVVMQPNQVASLYTPEAMELVNELREEDQEEAGEYLDGKLGELHRAGLEASAVVVSDASPAQAIVERAHGELVVMSTHGRGVVDRAVFGSVADKVVRGGRQPVLVIPARLSVPSAASGASEEW